MEYQGAYGSSDYQARIRWEPWAAQKSVIAQRLVR